MNKNIDYKKDLAEKLEELKKIEGFPIGTDEDILALSKPPYYTACPNPYIKDFIKEYGTPYDEETDEYHREPFVADVSEGKGHHIYNAHTYHTKVPHKAIIPFIKHYTEKDDVVLDGFCGTGMTGIAAQETSRKAILSDLSPVASYITFNYNNPINILNFQNKTAEIIKKVKDEYGWIYKTMHSDKLTECEINYIVWSDIFISPFSNKEFIFYDVAVNKQTGKVLKEFHCPDTDAVLTKRMCKRAEISFTDQSSGKVIIQTKQAPVLINYSFYESNKGKLKRVSLDKTPDEKDLDLIATIDKLDIPYWYPINRMMEGKEARRNDKFGFTHIHHFFYKRNLLVLSAIYAFCTEPILKIWFTSQIINISKLNRYRPGVSFPYNPLSGTLYIGSLISESNVFHAYENKTKKILKALSSITKKNIVSIASATKLLIPENSIDYIFTDPPFGSNLMYSELSFIWESWLKVFTNINKEGVINPSQNKRLNEYNDLMLESFKEYYRVLKPKRWITVVFHNSKSAVWNGIQEAITKAGFIIAQVSTLDKQQGSFKQVTAAGAVANDLVISAFKPSHDFSERFLKQAGEGLEVSFVNEFLTNLPEKPTIERTDKMLYSKMLAYYIQRGYEVNYDAKSFYNLLQDNFVQEDGFWFITHQIKPYKEYKKKMKLTGIDDIKTGSSLLFVSDEKSALVWLYNFLFEPKTFSDISIAFNQVANIQDDDVPELSEMLEQNFVVEAGKYRRPEDELEQNETIDKRQRSLKREFETLLITTQTQKGKIKLVRREALVYGFELCYKDKRFADILNIADKLDKKILENSGELNDFVQVAEIMIKGIS